MLLWWGYIHFDSHLGACWLSAVLWCEPGGFFGLKHWCSFHGELLLFQHKASFCSLPGSQQISKPFLTPFISLALSRAGYGWQNWRACFGNRRQMRWITSWNVNMFSWSRNCASSAFSCCLRSGAPAFFQSQMKNGCYQNNRDFACGCCDNMRLWYVHTHAHTHRYVEMYRDTEVSDFAILLYPK